MEIKRLKFYAKLACIQNDTVSGLYLLFGKHELNCLLKKHNLHVNINNGLDLHVGIWTQTINQTFANSILNSLNIDLIIAEPGVYILLYNKFV